LGNTELLGPRNHVEPEHPRTFACLCYRRWRGRWQSNERFSSHS